MRHFYHFMSNVEISSVYLERPSTFKSKLLLKPEANISILYLFHCAEECSALLCYFHHISLNCPSPGLLFALLFNIQLHVEGESLNSNKDLFLK